MIRKEAVGPPIMATFRICANTNTLMAMVVSAGLYDTRAFAEKHGISVLRSVSDLLIGTFEGYTFTGGGGGDNDDDSDDGDGDEDDDGDD